MCRLCPYEGIPRRPHIFEGNHVKDAVLAALEEDQISGFNRHRDMCDSQVIAGHVMDANGSSEHGETVTPPRRRNQLLSSSCRGIAAPPVSAFCSLLEEFQDPVGVLADRTDVLKRPFGRSVVGHPLDEPLEVESVTAQYVPFRQYHSADDDCDTDQCLVMCMPPR